MQVLETVVRKDWQEITQQILSDNARLWRTILAVVALSALVVLLIGLLPLSKTWQLFFRIAASFSVFCILSLWAMYRSQRNVSPFTLVACLLFVGNAAIATLTRPPSLGEGIVSPWPVGLAVLIPLTSSLFLLWSHRKNPDRVGQLGLVTNGWATNLIIGALAGGILSFHLLLTAGSVAGRNFFHAPTLIWAFCYSAGLQALGEELLFRGLSFPVLHEGLHNSFWKAVMKVSLLNFLVYLVLMSQNPTPMIGVWIVAYRAGLGFIAILLRHRQRSLIPCLACNIVFNMFLILVIK